MPRKTSGVATTSTATKSKAMGPVEKATRADVRRIQSTHPMAAALSAAAFTLARQLDQGAGMAGAAINRELRNNLLALASEVATGDDDLGDALSEPSGGGAGAATG